MVRNRSTSGTAVLLVVFLLLVPLRTLSGQAGTDSPEALGRAFVRAINDKSAEERKKLLHPRSAACINPQTQPFFDWIFSRQFKYEIPSNYRAATHPYASGDAMPPEAKADYPARPTHVLQIDYSTRPFNSTTILLAAVKEGPNWYEVLPCPQPEAVTMAISNDAKSKEIEARAKSLAANLRDPLRAEIIALAKDGHRIDAMQKYAAASGEELVVARDVVDLLAPEK